GYALEWGEKTFRFTDKEKNTGLGKIMEEKLQTSWSVGHVPGFFSVSFKHLSPPAKREGWVFVVAGLL
ncbi:hypothetical protein, partial [Salmonella enterica]|uniref:hypothetical protein n=1 Tax=Salmonella enterica TaxID=28901 RepID=UPI000AF2C5D3